MKMKDIIGKEYVSFLNEIKSRIVSARIQAIRSVSKELIELYWDIGKTIAKRQQKHKWGDAVVEKLANDLKEDFETTFGFSVQNLWYMRQFYLVKKLPKELKGKLPDAGALKLSILQELKSRKSMP